uniref:Putative secreted peptide n=1 Tax=Anopheles braziliensis TaxID=58242 RepID=A0A2M3ZSH6_9DIPT
MGCFCVCLLLCPITDLVKILVYLLCQLDNASFSFPDGCSHLKTVHCPPNPSCDAVILLPCAGWSCASCFLIPSNHILSTEGVVSTTATFRFHLHTFDVVKCAL